MQVYWDLFPAQLLMQEFVAAKARKTQSSSNSPARNVQTLGFRARCRSRPPTRPALASKVAGRGSVRHPFDALQVALQLPRNQET